MTEVLRPAQRILAIGAVAILLGALATKASDRLPKHENAAPDAASVERGAKLYAEACSNCHGNRADGNPAAVIPSLAGQHSNYLLKQLVAFTDSQRDSPVMHQRMAAQALDSPRIWRDLAVYLSTLPINSHPQTGDGASLDQGKRIYQQFCIDCHGRYGEGNAAGAVAALRGQDYAYLAKQLRAFATSHRDDMEVPVLERISRLSQAEIDAVADYASRLPVDR